MTVPLRLSTSLLKRSDIRSPPCPVALTETEQNPKCHMRRKSQSEPSSKVNTFSWNSLLRVRKNNIVFSLISHPYPPLPVQPSFTSGSQALWGNNILWGNLSVELLQKQEGLGICSPILPNQLFQYPQQPPKPTCSNQLNSVPLLSPGIPLTVPHL